MKIKDINLIPKQYFKDKSKSKIRGLYILLAVALTAILAYSYISPLLYIKELQAESESFNGSLVELKSVEKKIESLQSEKQAMEKRLAVLGEISKNEIKPTGVIEKIKKVMPKEVSLTSLEYTSGSITMEAVSKTAAGVSEFMVELTKIDGFKNVTLSPVVNDGEYYKFSIALNMNQGSDKDAAAEN